MKLKFTLVLLLVLGFIVGCSFPKIHVTSNIPSWIKARKKQRYSKTNRHSYIKAKDRRHYAKTNSRPPIKVRKKQHIPKTNINNKGKWIIPSPSVCKRNGGINDNGCTTLSFSDAKAICSASGGSLPSIDMLKKEVTDCGGDVVDILSRKSGNFFAKWSKNKDNSNYHYCYNQKGFTSSTPYWAKSRIDSKNVLGMDFYMGNVKIIDAFSKATVLCVR